jgi:hypothetical protein
MVKIRSILVAGLFFGGIILGLLVASGAGVVPPEGIAGGPRQPAPPPSPPDGDVTIPEGAVVQLRILRSVSSDDAKVNDRVDFLVVEGVKVGDTVVIPAQARAWGTVKEVKAGGKLKGNPKLVIRLDRTYAADGKTPVPLRVGVVRTSDPEHAYVLTIATKSRDEPAHLAVGSTLAAYVDADVTVPVESARPEVKPPPPEKETPKPRPPQETVMVRITSDPDGAEIVIDGKFVGTAPGEFPLAVGDHSVACAKRGYKRKEYPSFTALAGAKPNINCELEKE